MSGPPRPPSTTPSVAILLVIIGMAFITVNDSLVKSISGDYALHQMVFIRSAVGLAVTSIFLYFEGGLKELRTATPGLHIIRGLFVVGANMLYFAALAIMPLADAVAAFFVAPLIITAMSAIFLQERVGPHRIGAILVGFLGVLLMTRPGMEWDSGFSRWILLLPVAAAACYAGMQVMTRKLGVYSKASALTIYVQLVFLAVSTLFFLVAGQGQFAHVSDNQSWQLMFRAWRWPDGEDWPALISMGVATAAVGYTLSAAYRMGNAATVSSYEYVALPMAIFSGWMFFGEVPDFWVLAGILLIGGSGIYVFLRERRRRSPIAPRRPLRRG